MRFSRWQILFGASLILLSAVLYLLHYAIFRDLHHIGIYMIGDMAFLPIEVLLVGIIIHEILNSREKQGRLQKLNMVIGSFFSEVGTPLLALLAKWDTNKKEIDLEHLKNTLIGKRDFLLRLLENPNLLEHESFTDLLWAVFHLIEELMARPSLKNLPEADHNHLSGDIKRVYTALLKEWEVYLKHLKSSYPYLYSLAMRTNPLDPSATPIVKS